MKLSAIILGLALAASAALNAYLLIAGGSDPAPAADPRSETDDRPIKPASRRVVIGVLDDRELGCDRVLAGCREARAALERELDARRPANKRFEQAAPESADPELVTRLEKAARRLLGDLDHNVECRESVCRIEVIAGGDQPSGEWMRSLQSDPEFRGLAGGMMFEAARPTTDPVSGKGLVAHRMFVALNDADAVSGTALLEGLIAGLEDSGEIDRCGRVHQGASGTLSYRLRIADGRIGADFGGDLYATAAGRCIAEAQSRIAGEAELPPEVTSAVVYHHVSLPREGQ